MRMDTHDDDAADLHDREYPDEADTDHDESVDFVPCPYCGKMIPDDADLCNYCRNFIVPDSSRLPLWILIGVVLAVLVAGLLSLRY